MPDEQRLNSLDRFRKQPGQLVLEEHSHCEVPAGCGGVVLRWRNPFAAVPLTLQLYTPRPSKLFLDGELPRTGRIDLVPGRHVAALVIEDVALSGVLLLFAASHDPGEFQREAPLEVSEPTVSVHSAGDGTWKYVLRRPTGDWELLSFDDSGWPALVEVPGEEPASNEHGAWQYRRCVERGATSLGLPPAPPAPPTGTIWVRKVFDVPPAVLRRATE